MQHRYRTFSAATGYGLKVPNPDIKRILGYRNRYACVLFLTPRKR